MGVVRRSARSPACPLVCSVLCVNTGARLCRDWWPMFGVARHSPPIPGLRQLRTVLLVRVLGIAWAHCQYLRRRLPGEPKSNLRGRVQHLAKDFQGGYSYACGSGAPERGLVAERHGAVCVSAAAPGTESKVARPKWGRSRVRGGPRNQSKMAGAFFWRVRG